MKEMIYEFNKRGMTEDELKFFANYEDHFPEKTILESEVYGSGVYLRQYGFYPQRMPLFVHTDHGPNQWDFVTPSTLLSKADYFGFYSKRLYLDWKTKSTKTAFVIKSPFWFYKSKCKIIKKANAQGSIYFHAHSTFWTDKETDYKIVFDELNKLPEIFKPISVCMHFVDIQKGRHKVYIENGFPVFTAGNWKNKSFVNNFYEIIRNFNYGISNSFGSHVFYCTDLGLPFTLINAEPSITNNIDPNSIASGMHYKEHKQMQRCSNIFNGVNYKVSEAQMNLTADELGLNHGLSRVRMALFLYRSLLEFRLKHFHKKVQFKVKKLLNFLRIARLNA